MPKFERTARLTKRAVEGAARDAGRTVFLWDTDVRGFGLRVLPSGVIISTEMVILPFQTGSPTP